jgi:hypothetical protein
MSDAILIDSWIDLSKFPLTPEAVKLLYPTPDYLVRSRRYDSRRRNREIGLLRRIFIVEGRVAFTLGDGEVVTLQRGQMATTPTGERTFEVLDIPAEVIVVWSWNDMRAITQWGYGNPLRAEEKRRSRLEAVRAARGSSPRLFGVDVGLRVETSDGAALATRVSEHVEEWASADTEWTFFGQPVRHLAEFTAGTQVTCNGDQLLLRLKGAATARWWEDVLCLRMLPELKAAFTEIQELQEFDPWLDCP